MNRWLLIVSAVFVLVSANTVLAVSIHVEYRYTPPSEPLVSGFQLYQEGVPSCSTDNKDATSIDCDVELEKDTTYFSLTAMFNDGSESPPSNTFAFTPDIKPPIIEVPTPKIYKIEVNDV